MPDILTDPGSDPFGGAMSWLELERQIEEAEAQVTKQRKTIAHLAAEGREVTAARQQLVSMLENLAFLKKLCSA